MLQTLTIVIATACYPATGEGCADIYDRWDKPYFLVEFPPDGGRNVLQELPTLDDCRDVLADAFLEVTDGTDFGCFPK